MEDYNKWSTDHFILDELFQAWVLRPDEENERYWLRVIKEFPEKKNEIEEARWFLENLPQYIAPLQPAEVSNLWLRIRKTNITPVTVGKSSLNKWIKISVAAAVLLIAAVLAFYPGSKPITYATGAQKQLIILPDSSSVILNAWSCLELSSSWEKGVREVTLEGEGFFNVTHTYDDRPFRLLTASGISVNVLGTSFNVSTRKERTQVLLEEGKILLRVPDHGTQQEVVMKPGELIALEQDGVQKMQVNPRLFTSWREGKLDLNESSLADLIEMLELNYGLKVSVGNAHLLKQTISGSIPYVEGEEMLYQIAKAFRLHVNKEKERYLLTE